MHLRSFFLTGLFLAPMSCVDTTDDGAKNNSEPTSEEEEEETGCSSDSDADDDGIDDCEEEEWGTDPENADSDEDGFTDQEEIDCVSDPLDGDESCYACGWAHNDPGDLESTGDGTGDVIDSFELVDQCGEMVDIWDFHGEYHVLYKTAAW